MKWMSRKLELTRGARAVAASLVSLALVVGCAAPQADLNPSDTPEAQQIRSVKVAEITKQIISEPDEVVADVVASVQIDLVLKVDGDVLELVKNRGDFVKKDEVIFRLDHSDAITQKERADLAVKSADSQLRNTRQDIENGKMEMKSALDKLQRALDQTQRQFNKLRNDYDIGLVSDIQLEQAEDNLKNMEQDFAVLHRKYETMLNTDSIAGLEVQLRSAQLNAADAAKALQYYDVKAPVSGILTDLYPQVGMTLGRGGRVGQIQQVDPIKIQTGLTETARKLIAGKEELSFRVSGSINMMKGKISYLADVMNSQTNAYDLELEIPNENTVLKPGMKVQVQLTNEHEQEVVAIPTTSVVREGALTYVFVLNNDVAEKRQVELGRLKETNQEVLLGLKEGETLIVSGQQQLKDKEKVQVSQ